MERRDLLKMIAAATGVAFVGAEAWAAGGASSAASEATVDFSAKDVQLLDEIAETILPATQTPGAKAAGCGAVMATFIRDCYEPAQQQLVKAGLVDIRALAKHQFNNDFLALTAAQKLTLLQALDTASKNASSGSGGNSSLSDSKRKQRDGAPHYFVLLKQLSIFTFLPPRWEAPKCCVTKRCLGITTAICRIKKAIGPGQPAARPFAVSDERVGFSSASVG